jgi:hypothetical protein
MANISQTEDQFLLGYGEVSKFLTRNGFRIAESTLNKLHSVGKGPPVEWNWGRTKRFLASKTLACAQARALGLYGRTRIAPAAAETMPPPPRDQRLIDIPDDELPPF